MRQWLHKWFLQHPRDLKLTYGQHARGSLGLAAHFGSLMCKATVHAIVPGLFSTSSTDGIEVALPQHLQDMRRITAEAPGTETSPGPCRR